MKRNTIVNLSVLGFFLLVICVSLLFDYQPGRELGFIGWHFAKSMFLLFPGAFILIGLFEVWIDRSLVEKHLGDTGGPIGYIWMLLLAATVMAPLIIALPMARSLSEKGARLQLVMGFLGFSTVIRIPMTIFEATYLGLPFTAVRMFVSLPLIIISAEILGRMFSSEYQALQD